MVQLGRRLSLALEPLSTIFILAEMRRKELESDLAVKLRILGQIHLPHTTGTDHLDTPVVRHHRAFG
jgi:hypothetical protein